MEQSRIINYLYTRGTAAQLTYYSGAACPCFSSRDSTHVQYDPAWHRNNLTAENCSGTGLIKKKVITLNLKWRAFNEAYLGLLNAVYFKEIVPVGELNRYELVAIGTIDTSGNYVSLKSYLERQSFITYLSEKFSIKKIYQVESFCEIIGLNRYE